AIMGAMFADMGEDALGFTIAFTVVSSLGWMLVVAILITGLHRLREVPVATGARGLAQAAFTLSIMTLLLNVVGLAVTIPQMSSFAEMQETTALEATLTIVGALVQTAGLVTFILALQRAAHYIQHFHIA